MSRRARVVTLEELSWWEPPGHPGALSKLLVNPATAPTRQFDFRISLYRPGGRVEDHVHERAEHVYYVLSGCGLMTLDGERTVVGPHRAVFIPPGVRHAFVNNGLDDLVFVVVTSPPGELPLGTDPE
ncbi:MAG TPA: cupin domain-containing protein [Candidatus Dormibacteraeota bacterium]|nr:cupin domain-containing protein [Candidatus Dormibacteraeota bacterium]